MDSSLLRQHQAFRNRALATPVVEKSSKRPASPSASKLQKKTVQSKNAAKKVYPSNFSHAISAGNKHKFSILADIVKHMKARHQKGDTHALSLDEILEECHIEDKVTSSQKHWLLSDALPNNPKITVHNEFNSDIDKFTFKPKYNIKDKKALLKLLDQHDQRGLGGIMVDDIIEGLPKAKKCLKILENKIIFVTRSDKKDIAFYNDKSCEYDVDEEFKQLWRSIAVDSIDDNKIEEYLNMNNITTVGKTTTKVAPQKRKKVNRKRKFKMHNDHLNGVLEDYSSAKK